MKCVSLLSLIVVACSDQVAAPSKPTPVAPTTPTIPVAQPGPLAEWLIVSAPVVSGSGAAAHSVAYVSLPSGYLNPADSVVISNPRTGASVSPAIIAGGFDPVAIDAALNDTIYVATPAAANRVAYTLAAVAARTPLRLVRTDPVNGSSAVAADVSVLAVLSEPLNPATLSGGIRLSTLDQDVPEAAALDSTGTRVTLRPQALLAAGDAYLVDISPNLTGVTGAKPAGTTEVSFETAPIGDPNAISRVTGEWDATSWRFTDVNSPGGGIWDDPVLGWGPDAYYRLHLTVAPTDSGAPGAVLWRLKMTWRLGGADTGSADIRGTATIGTTWWLGRTTTSPWIDVCAAASACPLQDVYDFKRDANALVLTRRDTTLLYLDGINPAWPAREVLTLQPDVVNEGRSRRKPEGIRFPGLSGR